MKNGTKVARGPVFGSYNVIGVGVSFKHGYVFFTYHGIPIFPAVKCDPKSMNLSAELRGRCAKLKPIPFPKYRFTITSVQQALHEREKVTDEI